MIPIEYRNVHILKDFVGSDIPCRRPRAALVDGELGRYGMNSIERESKSALLLIVPSRYFCGGSFCFMSWCLKYFCAVGALCMFAYF